MVHISTQITIQLIDTPVQITIQIASQLKVSSVETIVPKRMGDI
jgi:hypothetical protein